MSPSTVLSSFLETPDEAKGQFMQRHKRELLSDRTDAILNSVASDLPVAKAAYINVMRELLRDANRNGVKQAFNQFQQRQSQTVLALIQFLEARSLDHSKQLLHQEPDILTDMGIYMLNMLVMGAQSQNVMQDVMFFSQYLILLLRCREIGTDRAFAEIQRGDDDYWMLSKR